MSKTTVEHQNMGCRLCSTSCEEGDQTAYLLCPDCRTLSRVARDLLVALEYTTAVLSGCLGMLPEHVRGSAAVQVEAAQATIAKAKNHTVQGIRPASSD